MNECTGCHQPLRGNDYVYTMPISTAKVSGAEVVNNSAAALPATFALSAVGLAAINMYVDPAAHATATLYGNDAAMQAVQALRAVPASRRRIRRARCWRWSPGHSGKIHTGLGRGFPIVRCRWSSFRSLPTANQNSIACGKASRSPKSTQMLAEQRKERNSS